MMELQIIVALLLRQYHFVLEYPGQKVNVPEPKP